MDGTILDNMFKGYIIYTVHCPEILRMIRNVFIVLTGSTHRTTILPCPALPLYLTRRESFIIIHHFPDIITDLLLQSNDFILMTHLVQYLFCCHLLTV